jgi:hypothetical protein
LRSTRVRDVTTYDGRHVSRRHDVGQQHKQRDHHRRTDHRAGNPSTCEHGRRIRQSGSGSRLPAWGRRGILRGIGSPEIRTDAKHQHAQSVVMAYTGGGSMAPSAEVRKATAQWGGRRTSAQPARRLQSHASSGGDDKPTRFLAGTCDAFVRVVRSVSQVRPPGSLHLPGVRPSLPLVPARSSASAWSGHLRRPACGPPDPVGADSSTVYPSTAHALSDRRSASGGYRPPVAHRR